MGNANGAEEEAEQETPEIQAAEEGVGMQVDRPLGKTTDGRIVDITDVECAFLVAGKGAILSDAEAARLGITAYYERKRREERQLVLADVKAAQTAAVKEVQKTDAPIEDKAVDGPSERKADEAAEAPPAPGVIMPPETRRLGGRRG